MTVVWSSIVRSSVSAVWISGSPSGGNSTSTTGPITRTTRPAGLVPFPFSFAMSALSSSLVERLAGQHVALGRGGGGRQRLRATHDLRDLRGDLRLAGLVGDPRVGLDQLVRVVGGRLHGPLPGRVLRRGRLEQRREHPHLDVPRDEVVENGLGVGL